MVKMNTYASVLTDSLENFVKQVNLLRLHIALIIHSL
jgi:hypothetical protein